MRMPQVSEKVKEAPAQALRGVFAGLGQLLLITDKLRNKTPIHSGASHTKTTTPPATEAAEAAPEAPVAATPVVPEAAPVVDGAHEAEGAPGVAAKPEAVEDTGSVEKQRDSGKTGNVRLLTERTTASEAVEAVEVRETSEVSEASGTEVAGEPEVAAEAKGTETAGAEDAGGGGGVQEAPLPNYDELTVASLRARLRNLSIEQVRELAEYERAHAGRPEVVAMFERRVAKLEAGA